MSILALVIDAFHIIHLSLSILQPFKVPLIWLSYAFNSGDVEELQAYGEVC